MARRQREEEVNAEAERHRERRRRAQRESQELQKQLDSLQQEKAANVAGGEVHPERVSPSDQSPGYNTEIKGSKTLDPRSPLSFELQSAPWPKPFVLNKCNNYNGMIDLYAFVLLFETSIEATGGMIPRRPKVS